MVKLSQSQVDAFYQGWAGYFAMGRWAEGARFSVRERAVIGLATTYFVARCPQTQLMNVGMCFAASEIVRVAARENGLRAEPVTVALQASHMDRNLSLGSLHPRIGASRDGTSDTWSGHEIVHFPDVGAVFDLTITQLSTWDDAVLPVVAEAPAVLRAGDRIPVVLAPRQIKATYTVQQLNRDYTKMPSWPAIERIATDGIQVVREAVDPFVAALPRSAPPPA